MGRKINILIITFILIFQMMGSGMGITHQAFAAEPNKQEATETGASESTAENTQNSTEDQTTDNQQNNTDEESTENTQNSNDETTTDNQQTNPDDTDTTVEEGDSSTDETSGDQQQSTGEDSTTNEKQDDMDESNSDNSQNDTDKEGAADEQQSNIDEETKQDQQSQDQDDELTEQQSQQTEDQEVQVQNTTINENILTNADLLNEEGNPVESVNSNSEVELLYNFELEDGHGYTEGAQFTFNLPQEFNVYNPIDNQPLPFNGEDIGHFSVTSDGEVTVEFNEFIEEYSNINGEIRVWTEMDETTKVEEDKTITVTPIQGGESVSIPVNFNSGASAVEKQGIPESDYNAQSAEWTVDFNKTMKTIENASLNDPIQDGQQLTEDSIELYHLNVNLNGEVERGELVDPSQYSIGTSSEGGDFSIDFGGNISSAYRAVFETQLVDENKTEFQNTASLLENGSNAGDATATVAVERGTPLEKNTINYDDVNQTITWEIKYNYNEKSIGQADALLEDDFTDSHALVSDSIEVTEMSIDQNGNASESEIVTNYNVTPDSDESGFDLQFNNNINNAYKITFQTEAKDRVFDGGTIRNDVTASENSAWAEREFGQGILHKSNHDPNYQEKTVWWDITLNHDDYSMDNVVLEEVFTNEGLSLKPETVEVTSMDESEYTIQDNGDNFTIEFNNTIDSEHTVTFQTDFDYEERSDHSLNYLENQAVLKWGDSSGTSQEKTVSSRFTPDDYTLSNGFKSGSYNAVTKEITWDVGVNYNLEELTDATVEDEITDNQQLLEDSIVIHEMELTGGANGAEEKAELQEDEYELTINRDSDGNPESFDIAFNEPITNPYKISYKTSLDNLDLVQGQYDNVATIYDGATEEFELFAEVSIPHGGAYSDKSGVQDGKIIDWQVDINFAQSQVANATVIDTPSSNQMLLEDSFHVYKTDVQNDGSVAKGEELSDDAYAIEFREDPTQFELQFNNEINEPYILEYQSFIQAAVGDEINNDISFAGENIEEETWSSESTVTVERTQGIGSGSGELSSLTVDKVDALDDETLLPGAVFTLKDASSGIVVDEKETDDNGQVVFEDLMNGDYILKEKEAPENYQLNDESIEIEITGDTVEEIPNNLIEGSVTLTKVDENTGNPLEGTVYELWQGENEVETGLETNAEGKITVQDLRPGDYQFIETQAAENYQLDDTPVEFTIERSAKEEDVERVAVTADNQLIPGSVVLTKIDEDNPEKTLQGAEFKLQTDSGEPIQENLTTTENGEITVDELQPGDYEFIETKAPEHYQRYQSPVPFTIEKSAKEADVEQVTVEVENKLILGTVELTKVDQNEPGTRLEGAVYELQDGEGDVIKENLTTDENGKIVVEDLYPGDYQLVETKAPEHYQMPDDPEPITFSIPKGQEETKTLTDDNELIPGSVALTKVAEDNPDQSLEGAVFELQDSNGTVLEEGLTTNGEGRIVIGDLRPGTYQFVETEAPNGYQLDNDPVSFQVERSQEEAVTLTVENDEISSGGGYNPPEEGSVILTKTAAGDAEKVLEGAVFDLKEMDGDLVEEGLTTNEDGEIEVTDLERGDYQFVETEAPDDYLLEEDPVPFEIEEDEETTVTVENEKVIGSVTLTKVHSNDQNNQLQRAVFDLEEVDGDIVEENLATDESGEITVVGLEPGAYQFVETEAPEGYQLNAEPIGFEIGESQEETVSLTAENAPIQGSVVLTKVSAGNEDHLLSGAVFDLETSDGNVVEENLSTDDNGEIAITDLSAGDYQFVETEAPDGYQLNERPLEFTIEEEQEETVTLTPENEVKPGAVQLIKTAAGDTEQVLEGAVFNLENSDGSVLQEGLRTGADGTVTVTNLEPGSYQFVETKAPEGYERTIEPVSFDIEAGQIGIVVVTMENEKIPGETTLPSDAEGSVALTKVNEADTDELLEGAEFTLQAEDGTTIKEGLTTNDSGKIFVNGLDPGSYQFIETNAPDGYEREEDPTTSFHIEEGQTEAVEVTVENAQASDEDSTGPDQESPFNSGYDDAADGREEENNGEGQTLPNTSSSIFNYGLAGAIALIAGLIVRRRRKA
ncbi:LPXTG-motif cell wall-anchored protein [Salibacterium salarium]|uniref:SpaA isopeptide-forming pilin-related protein n=1 Tax=Salibacterium salarium TaxID=284579 RepID=UPI0027837285|nr:SpaA isopeptide-forming pilin-related protein [Salibacterium salarium]MDQ0297649.1 LPXTG-motif cell wall-anchored protein [Salibacterium salarium]